MSGVRLMNGPRRVTMGLVAIALLVRLVAVAGAAPCNSDASWDPRFFIPGADSSVGAVATMGSDVFIGGTFSSINGQPVAAIAKWDGTTWSALGTGVVGDVTALAVRGTDLYVGGTFIVAGGVAVNHIAKWDGSTWSALDAGLLGDVRTLAVMGSDLYAGGGFAQTTRGVAVNYVAKWDGSSWSAVGTGADAPVLALAVAGSDLYAGGLFASAGGHPAAYVAKWDGAEWSALGIGTNDQVAALAVDGTDVYAGGKFTDAGGTPANLIAKWDGSTWSALGVGMDDHVGTSLSAVYALTVLGTDLIAGGNFATAGGISVHGIARWDGSTWSPLGSSPGEAVYALASSGSTLWAGGSFVADDIPANRIARWDGSTWSALAPATAGLGLNSDVLRLVSDGHDVYAGGFFTASGGRQLNHIGKWDGTTWSPLGTGMRYGDVGSLALSGTDLYAAGTFTVAGDVIVNFTAKWDGSSWSALGSGVAGRHSLSEEPVQTWVAALAARGTDVYAGGQFRYAGAATARNIAKWDGAAWSALGAGTNDPVQALALQGSDLYVGGGFTDAGGVSVHGLAKWDGSAWSDVGGGVDGFVSTILVSGADLYVGGWFTTAGGESAHGIAKWDGATWSALGAGIDGWVSSLVMEGTTLYVGGNFSRAGEVDTNGLARWDGTNWSGFGTALDSSVLAIAVIGTDVYAGGIFQQAGQTFSHRFARWAPACGNCMLDPGEQCDDDSECCSATCAFEPIDHTCSADDNPCTADACDGAGTCVATPANGIPCDGGGSCSGTCQAGVCEANCATAYHDSVVLPLKPLSVTIPRGQAQVTKSVAVTVRNADGRSVAEGGGHTIELTVDASGCPTGTVGTPDFDRGLPGDQSSTLLGAGRTKTAKVPITIQSTAFDTFNLRSPTRCTLAFIARTVTPEGSSDPTPWNDRALMEINVVDKNDAEQSATHEALLRSVNPVMIGITGGRSDASKRISVALVNGDYRLPGELDAIQLVVTGDPRCPGVSASGVDCRAGSDTAMVHGGALARCHVTVTAAAAQLSTPNRLAPQRCTLALRAIGPSDPESAPLDASNNTAALVIDVINKNP